MNRQNGSDSKVAWDSTQKELANAINVPFQRINEIVLGKRGLTPSTALRLAKYFGMSSGFWLNLQVKVDIYVAEEETRRPF